MGGWGGEGVGGWRKKARPMLAVLVIPRQPVQRGRRGGEGGQWAQLGGSPPAVVCVWGEGSMALGLVGGCWRLVRDGIQVALKREGAARVILEYEGHFPPSISGGQSPRCSLYKEEKK